MGLKIFIKNSEKNKNSRLKNYTKIFLAKFLNFKFRVKKRKKNLNKKTFGLIVNPIN